MMQSYYVSSMLDQTHPRYSDGVAAAAEVNRIAFDEGGVKSLSAMTELLDQSTSRENIELYKLGAFSQELGDEYRKMILAAFEKQRGSDVGAVLTCEYTHSKGGHEFLMWTHAAGKAAHALLASETSQERLDAHWQGFVANLSPIAAASQLAPSRALPSTEKWSAAPATGAHCGAIKEISDTEVIQHVGQGRHVVWQRTGLTGEPFNIDDVVQIDADGHVQSPRKLSNDLG